MKRNLILLTTSLFFLTSIGFVFAETSTPSSTLNITSTSNSTAGGKFFDVGEINNLIKEASNAANRKQDQLANVIKAADEMIANRITSLNALNTRIQNDTRLTSDEKTSLTADVQNAITGLNTLKTTIDADTDVTKAKSDAKLIVTNYYVYMKLEPKTRMLITLNNLQTITTNIQALTPQVQNLINTLGTQGKDITGLNSLLTDITSQLTTISSTIATDITSLNGITTSSTNADAVFTQVKNDLNTIVKTDFGKVRDDFKQMRDLFRKLILGTGAPIATPFAVSSGSGVPVVPTTTSH